MGGGSPGEGQGGEGGGGGRRAGGFLGGMGSMLLGDLDDYIAPAQDCVVALSRVGSGTDGVGRVTLVEVDDADDGGGARFPAARPLSPPLPLGGAVPGASPGHGRLARAAPPLSPGRDIAARAKKLRGETRRPQVPSDAVDEAAAIKISLSDCLVCSGCVTSAEAVLLEAHGVVDFVRRADEAVQGRETGNGGDRLAVTVCPQAAASLAARLGVTPQAAFARLARAVARRHAGVAGDPILLSSDAGRRLALHAAADEFVDAWRDRIASPAAAGPRVASQHEKGPAEVGHQDPGSAPRLPLFASACPGWVCYCEKVLHAALPHLSRVRSPQQTVGALLKAGSRQSLSLAGVGARWVGVRAADQGVFHVTVMPCYEKKLESLRPDFAPGGVRDVDASLTTSEALELVGRDAAEALAGAQEDRGEGGARSTYAGELAESGVRALLNEDADLALEEDFLAASAGCASLFPPGSSPSSSGGYADYVYARVAVEVYGLGGPALVPAWRPARGSPDLVQATLEADAPDGTRHEVRFARVYGFKNIQNVVRRLKSGRLPYDYVEIMACPSGCVNGGGQLPPPLVEGQADSKGRQDHVGRVEALYRQAVHVMDPTDGGWDPAPMSTGGGVGQDALLLRTGFHPIPKFDSAGLSSAKLAW